MLGEEEWSSVVEEEKQDDIIDNLQLDGDGAELVASDEDHEAELQVGEQVGATRVVYLDKQIDGDLDAGLSVR